MLSGAEELKRLRVGDGISMMVDKGKEEHTKEILTVLLKMKELCGKEVVRLFIFNDISCERPPQL